MSERPSLWKSTVAGGGAGAIEILCMYPLDVVKTRTQLQRGRGNIIEGATQYRGVWHALTTIVRQEGPFRLYRGIASPILAEAPKRAIKFGSNEGYKSLIHSMRKGEKLKDSDYLISGIAAGTTETFVNCPFEVVKVRMQAKENIGVYKNTVHAATSIIRNEGILSLYKGFEPQALRNGIWNGIYFGLINKLKNGFKTSGYFKNHDLLLNFVAGSIASGVGTTCNTPFDVVKSRNQNLKSGTAMWSIPTLFHIWKTEGFKALYRGYTARMLRLVPGGGIMIVAFDFFSKLMS
eukprot:TRINITY_DN980_c0_g1_i1.p1 TRINITY_DN980_c0_g1~~TRINITY_DN980_c0_g1_i1.p1  ORF type:complete len:292 (-),score=36.85 TRINITY_DN980_c0_g1_i1:142-1017(-)